MKEKMLLNFLENFAEDKDPPTNARRTSFVTQKNFSLKAHSALRRCVVCRFKVLITRLIENKCAHCANGGNNGTNYNAREVTRNT